jgi:hypothetical protein
LAVSAVADPAFVFLEVVDFEAVLVARFLLIFLLVLKATGLEVEPEVSIVESNRELRSRLPPAGRVCRADCCC